MIARRLRGLPLTAVISLLAHAAALAAAYALIEWQPAPASVVIAVELVAGASDVGEPDSPPDPAPDQPSSHRQIISAPSPAPAVAPAGTPERAPEPVHEEARPLPNPEPQTQIARTENAPATPLAHPLPPLPLAKPLHIPDAAVKIEIGAASVDDEPSSPKTPLTASVAPETAPKGDEETSPLERAKRTGGEEQVRPATTGGRIGQSTLTPMPGNPRPRYPLIARKRGYQGRVLLTVQIAGSGQVADITIAKSSGYALLDDAAMDAVRRWRFRSASGSDGPVDTIVEVPVTFKLEDTTATQP